jgi:predicted nucleotidyltransferase
MERVIFEKELAKVINISKYFGVGKVILFGSCLEEVESARDIDIAVKGGDPERSIEGRSGAPLDVADLVRLFVLCWCALEAHRRRNSE